MSSNSDVAPKRSVNQDRLRKCYEAGLRTQRQDRGLAHSMFSECVSNAPGNLLFVEAMLENLVEQFGKVTKRRNSFQRGLPGPIKRAKRHGEWPDVIRAGVEELGKDPWNIQVLITMAEACENLNLNEVELCYLKQALDANPKDPETNRHCARSLARMGQFDQSISCWHRVETLCPKDKEPAQMISKLTEDKVHFANNPQLLHTTTVTELTGEPDSPEEPCQSEAGSEYPSEMSPRDRLRDAIAQFPDDLENYVELADLFIFEGRVDDAETILLSGIDRSPDDMTLLAMLDDIRNLQITDELDVKRNETVKKRVRLGWFEVLAIVAVFAFVIQIVPGLQERTLHVIDLRNWSRSTFFIMNLLSLVAAILFRQIQLKRATTD